MADMPVLSRISPVPVRGVWAHEAHYFTQWLLLNSDVLSDVLGMDLELTAAEQRVGGFALDLIGTDLQTGDTVIIENQLESTDHGHLGQLLTYAGGTGPSTIVWCAPSFRDEHRAALDWLNEHTEEGIRFFGVKISRHPHRRITTSAAVSASRAAQRLDQTPSRGEGRLDSNPDAKGSRIPGLWRLVLDRIHSRAPHLDQRSGGVARFLDHPAIRSLLRLVCPGLLRLHPAGRALLRCHRPRDQPGTVREVPRPSRAPGGEIRRVAGLPALAWPQSVPDRRARCRNL
jgi:hypothetical protein